MIYLPIRSKTFIYYTPALFWGFFVALYTLMPGRSVPPALADMNDKILHGAIYFINATLIILGVCRYTFKSKLHWRSALLVWLFCVVFGGLIEILQYHIVSQRHGDWGDFWANNLGAAISVLSWTLFLRRS